MTVAVPEPEPSAVPLVGALPVDVPLAEVKRTLVGVHSFEETIHTKFEELVELGFLKLKPS